MRLIDICEINPKTETLDDDTLVSFVAMPDVSEDGKIAVNTIRSYSEVKRGYTCFKEGDVLFAKITPCMENGKGALAIGLKNGFGCGSTEFHVLRPNNSKVNGKWLYYLTSWSAFRIDAEKHMTGSAGQKRVPKSFLEKYEVTLPSIDDQQKQACQLDRVRRILDLRREELSAFDDLIKARFIEMFGTIHNNKLGFEIGTLESVSSAFFAGGDKPSDCSTVMDDEHPFSVYANGFENEGLQGYTSQCRVNTPSVTVSARGTIGYCFIRKAGFTPIVRLICITPNEQVSVEYLKYAIDTMDIKSSGTSQAQLTVPDFKKEKIIIPPMRLQNQFVMFVDQIDKSKSAIQKSLDETQLLFDSLMQEYFG